jgi:hypothetical protein
MTKAVVHQERTLRVILSPEVGVARAKYITG